VRSTLRETILSRDSSSLISHFAFKDSLKAVPDLLFELFAGLVRETESDPDFEKLLVSVSSSSNGSADAETTKVVRPTKRSGSFNAGNSMRS